MLSRGFSSLGPFSLLIASGVVYGWGSNQEWQLGRGAGSTVDKPELVLQLSEPIIEVAVGVDHSMMLSLSGAVYVCGSGSDGQLGLGSGMNAKQPTPVKVPNLPEIKAIAAGSGHSVALTLEGKVYTWGRNDHSQLGLGYTSASLGVPSWVPNIPVIIAIACGCTHTMAVTETGDLYMWGYNCHGETSQPASSSRILVPTLVPNIPAQIVSMATGYGHVILLLSDGRVYGWGCNSVQELVVGSSNSSSSISPQYLLLFPDNAVSLACSYSGSLALLADGRVMMITQGTAKVVPSLKDVVLIGCQRYEFVAITNENRVFKWRDGGDEITLKEVVLDGAESPYYWRDSVKPLVEMTWPKLRLLFLGQKSRGSLLCEVPTELLIVIALSTIY